MFEKMQERYGMEAMSLLGVALIGWGVAVAADLSYYPDRKRPNDKTADVARTMNVGTMGAGVAMLAYKLCSSISAGSTVVVLDQEPKLLEPKV